MQGVGGIGLVGSCLHLGEGCCVDSLGKVGREVGWCRGEVGGGEEETGGGGKEEAIGGEAGDAKVVGRDRQDT